MIERRLLIFESYQQEGSDRQLWRLLNPPGLPFDDNIDDYSLVKPAHCRPAIIDEVTKIIALLPIIEEWRLLGVLNKGPAGDILKVDGERFRRAIIEKGSTNVLFCSQCGAVCIQNAAPLDRKSSFNNLPASGLPPPIYSAARRAT